MEGFLKTYKEKRDLYISELKKFNRVINLISKHDIDYLNTRHIDDSEYSFRLFRTIKRVSNDYSIYDIGSGNGFPGIIWSLLDPDHSMTLVEIDKRKSEFLKHIIYKLKMTHSSVYCGDFRDIQPNKNAIFVMRSFMKAPDFISQSLFKEGFFIKGSTWNIEWEGQITQKTDLNAREIEVQIKGSKPNLVWTLNPMPYKLKEKQDRVLVYAKGTF